MLSLFSPRPEPITPRTPADLLAALALSPTCSTGFPSAVPCLSFIPPTPSTTSSSTSDTGPVSSSISTSRSDSEVANAEKRVFRRLTPLEARQLTLLLTQHFFPVRNSHKSLMRESIVLAERLHEAGIRWDRYRRVMGVHLRGIWTEGAEEHFGLLFQGSFLSIAEHPHPLDPTPLPIPLDPATYTALPRFTLNSNIAHIHKDHAYPYASQTHTNTNTNVKTNANTDGQGHGHEFELHDGLSNDLALTKNKTSQVGKIETTKNQSKLLRKSDKRGRWNERKKSVGLKIYTGLDGSHKNSLPIPVSATSARSLTLSLSHQNSRTLSMLRIDKLRRAFRSSARTRSQKQRKSGDKRDVRATTPGIVGLIPTLMPSLGLPLRASAIGTASASKSEVKVKVADDAGSSKKVDQKRFVPVPPGEVKSAVSAKRVSFAEER